MEAKDRQEALAKAVGETNIEHGQEPEQRWEAIIDGAVSDASRTSDTAAAQFQDLKL